MGEEREGGDEREGGEGGRERGEGGRRHPGKVKLRKRTGGGGEGRGYSVKVNLRKLLFYHSSFFCCFSINNRHLGEE